MAEKVNLRQQQKELTTERIVRSVIKHMGEHGYASSSLSVIAKDAGCAASLVVERFGSKEGLLAGVYQAVVSRYFASRPEIPDTAEARLLDAYDQVKTLQDSDPEAFLFLKTILLSVDIPDSFDRSRKDAFDQSDTYRAIRCAQAEGLMPPGDPYAIYAVFFHAMFTHLDICRRHHLPVPDGSLFLDAIGYVAKPLPETIASEAIDERAHEERARQRMLLGYIERHTEIAASFDLETGMYSIIAAGEDHPIPPKGRIADIFERGLAHVVPECREDFAKNMNLESIRERLEHSDKFSFQTFLLNPDGSMSRKVYTYYAVDDWHRFALAVREDTTEAYEREQAVGKAREKARASAAPSSDFIEEMLVRRDRRMTVLVVEDSDINREILGEILSPDYDVLFAEDGEVGLRVLSEHAGEVDLVLLDVYMPVCDGFEFLEHARRNPAFSSIPVVVATGSSHREDEERCLLLGATDFVTKPYEPVSLLSRIKGAIRVSASASSITAFEFDPLTGLYTYRAFVFHAQRALSLGGRYNVALIDIRDFGMLNNTHGQRACDETLKLLAEQLMDGLPTSLIARFAGRFFVLSPDTQLLTQEGILKYAARSRASMPVPNLRLNIGLCLDVDASTPVQVLCDRAKMAAESIEGDAYEQVAVYDEALEQRRAKDLKMLADFDFALEQHQFVSWIQPKVDSATGKVMAGEALVRWFDGEGNFVSPGDFIPLFEREGCIKDLDEYVFRLICTYQKDRMDAGKRIVPISVNLSRCSLFASGVAERYRSIAHEAGVPLDLVPLEITESAATSDRAISDVCDSFVQTGFSLHMDDFGTGYSSLSSLAELPFDVLKLDKSLIDRVSTEKGRVVVKNAVEIAQDLGMSVVAEGVEEQSQVDYLATLDCNLIQGYFYSPPKKMELFSELLDEDAPFSHKLAGNSATGDYSSFSEAELKRYLKVARGTHETVRVLDFGRQCYSISDEAGHLEACPGNCHDVWGRHEPCENCTSRRALETHGSTHKFEVLNGEAFIVYSKYFEVNGEPRVIELIDNVGSGPLHGVGRTTSFLDAVLTAGGEIYRDVQLGTLNRRYFEEKRDELASARALAVVDLDGLKEVNDQLGHNEGDALLAKAARAMMGCVRGSDRIVRMGGDEFLLIFSGMKDGALASRLESIRRAVADAGASVSIGGCYCDGFTDEAAQTADRAMYESKRTKKIVIY